MKRKSFSVYGYFAEHDMTEKYHAFCDWCYHKGRRISGKRIADEKELECIIVAWKEDVRNKHSKLKVKPWFLQTHTEKEYVKFYTFCRNQKHLEFGKVMTKEDIEPLIPEWEEYEKNRQKNNRFFISKEFRNHPEYGPYYKYCAWHKKRYGTGTRGIPEEIHRERITEFMREQTG